MFTTCPDCSRQYRVNAGQLAAASGQVRCGYCGRQFNALERLSDRPIVVADDRLRETRISSPRPDDDMPKSLEQEPQFDIPITGPAMESEPLPDDSVSGLEVLAEEELPGDLPEDLQDEPVPKSTSYRLLWGTGVFVLVLIIGAQLAWFNRDQLLQRYPELRPWAKQLCERLDCTLYRHRNISSIKILNRDVRLHPVVDNALLVNATMANRSGRIQPYPGIQFSLFDTNGAMIASREFMPEEYLDKSIAIDEGMSPEQPVHFVLEVTGPVEGAVSFEFRFL